MEKENYLTPTSGIDKIDKLGEEYISQVKSYAALGYSPLRIANLLNLSGVKRTALLVRISLPGDTYNIAYVSGQSLGEYNIDAELAKRAESGDVDAIELLENRKCERLEKDIRKELFGV